MASHSVVALKLRIAQERKEEKLKLIRKQSKRRKNKTFNYIRPNIRPHRPAAKDKLYVNTDYIIKDVKRQFKRRMEARQWSKHPLISQVVPYRNGAEAEHKLVRWVEKGEMPFSDKVIGPAANRSVFDYLTDHQLNLAIRISNEYKLKP